MACGKPAARFNNTHIYFHFIEGYRVPVRNADLPTWIRSLDGDDLQLIRRFILASGSLKELAAEYGVSYPTIRARIDSLIERLKLIDRHPADDVLEGRIRLLVSEGSIAPAVGKELLQLHRQTRGTPK
jgi:hypothetical protein